jgi:hypothetical protein
MLKFKVGDQVRLNRGKTKMTVLGYTPAGLAIASYLSELNSDDFKYPMAAYSTQHRPEYEFVAWDGHPLARTLDQIMTPKELYNIVYPGYNSTVQYNKIGETAKGLLVLENDLGNVMTFETRYCVKVEIKTFAAKVVGAHHTCHYALAHGETVEQNDLLMSKSGNLYTVTAVDTRARSVKKTFEGHRMVRQDL